MNLDRYSDNFFEVNHLNGFLPKKSPLAVLPDRYSELQVLIDEMPIKKANGQGGLLSIDCLLYTSPSPRDKRQSRMPSSA